MLKVEDAHLLNRKVQARRRPFSNRSLPSGGLGWPLVAFLLAVFLFNLATIQMFPIVWRDEVMFTEPAANWAHHGVLFSRAWFFDRETDIWAGNAPLYTVLLTPWLKLFGVTPLTARSFGLLLGTLGIAAWIAAAHRAGFLTTRLMTFLCAAVLLMAYGSGINLRSGRYDGLGILLIGLIALALSMAPAKRRSMALVLLGMLIPASGMHLVVVFFAGSLAAALVYGRKSIASILLIGFGIGLGLVLFLLALWNAGALAHFIYSVSNVGQLSGGEFPKDPSLFLVVLAAAANLALQASDKAWDARLTVISLYTLVVVATLLALGHFPNYYSWVVVFPLALAALLGRRDGGNRLSRSCRQAVALLLVMAVGLGVPLQLATTLVGPSRSYDRVDQFVASQVRRDDVAVVSAPAWYATWPVAAKTYTTEYDLERKFMTPADERRVSVLVIDPESLPLLEMRFGDNWRRVAVLDDPPEPLPLLSAEFGAKLTWQYRLAIYRRD